MVMGAEWSPLSTHTGVPRPSGTPTSLCRGLERAAGARRCGRRASTVTPPEGRVSVARDHLVDQPVLERLLGLEKAVALHVTVDLLDGPAESAERRPIAPSPTRR
jgi:hypothetical protein